MMRAFRKYLRIFLFLAILLLAPGVRQALAEDGQISGLVWLEKTVDGLIGSGEGGLADARVILETRDESGKIVTAASAQTPRSGDYLFSSLSAGEYRVRMELGRDYNFTLHGLDSAVLPAQGSAGCSPWFTLEENEKRTVNAGASKSSGSVSLVAFEDLNANGGRMQSEPAVRNAAVEVLYDFGGETYVIAGAVTDRDGQALIRDLSPGSYQVRVTFPDHFTAGPMGQKINTFYNCILPDTDTTGVSMPFSLSAKETVGMGIGLVRTGSLAGQVWFDANYNGKWDADESGLTDAEITLYATAGGFSRTARPDEKGNYLFQALQPGDYLIQFTLPEGMIFTYPGQSKLSDTASRGSLNAYAQVDVTTDVGAVGAMPAAGFSLTLYADMNLNGLHDADEPHLPGAAVTAAQGGKTVEKAQTDENGAAVFNALRGGDTLIEAALPEGWLFRADEGGLFPLSGVQSAARASLTLDGTEPDALYEAAVIPAAAISGVLFEDAANTGLFQAGSRLLPGFTVQAVSPEGAILAEAVTDENGAYTLYPLPAESLAVRFLLRDAYVASPRPADLAADASAIQRQTPDYGETEAIAVGPGARIEGVNAGVFQAGMAEGHVLVDEAYAAAGTGLPGVTVTLLNAAGEPAFEHSWDVTDENGAFSIKGILPGAYSLAYQLPEGGMFTDPAAEGLRYTGEIFTCESGSRLQAPVVKGMYTSTIAGAILHEAPYEVGMVSALLSLRGHTVSQAYEIHAAPDGSFAFAGLLPDTYTLSVTLPEGLAVGAAEGSLFAPSREGNSAAEITLALGESIREIVIPAVTPVSLTGVLYYDDNLSGERDGEEYGAENRALSLWENGQMLEERETDEEGGFRFDRLLPGEYELRIALDENEELVNIPGAARGADEAAAPVSVSGDTALSLPVMRFASVSGQVWSLGGGESVPGIAVTLLTPQGGALAEAISDGEGEFVFNRLMPGAYALSAALPEGYLFAKAQDTANRASYIQSAADGSVTAIPFDVPMGDDLSGMDIGVGTMGRIGDRAWLDVNGNGMQDMDEPGMPGILIELFQQGQLAASATTDGYGRYSLDNLYPGEYEMRVTMHKELKATAHQTEFPLVGSILPESDGETVAVSGVIVPSGRANLHCDLGFQLRKKDVYPEAMASIPVKDWRPYSER